MIHHRLRSLRMPMWVLFIASCITLGSFATAPLSAASAEPVSNTQPPAEPASKTAAQNPPAQNPPAQSPPAQSAPNQNPPNQNPPNQNPPNQNPPNQPNPFENVPQEPEKPNQPANPAGIQEAKPVPMGQNIIEAIDFRGQHRVPQDTLRALIYTKKGDVYDEESIHRDFTALWNTGRFDDLRIEREKGPAGGIVLNFVVTERRVIHTIDYTGNKSISKSEILDRFKERKLALSPESQYDPGRIQRGKNILQDYEAERGHQYATVVPQIRQVPPGGVDVTYAINEGPKVKVGSIVIDGNTVFSDRDVIRAMKNLKPIGLPHSLLFENLFARTYDSTKLEEDSERIRQFYQSKGYFMARVINHSEKVYDVQGKGIKIPLIKPNKPGKRVEITMVVSEGNKFTLRHFQFVGMKLFRTPDLIERQVFGMAPGTVFSTEKLQKGLDNLKKLYGDFGYIDFVPSPDPEPYGNNQIDLTVDVDEGHQFFVRRIDFSGNTSTRDRVIRRELLIDEGDLYSNRLWETSVLRLNQLGFFDPLKPEDAAQITRDTKSNTVDLLIKLKERGKNSIQLNGGVSGISGSFIGASYATNNFLGLGETLSLSSQIGTLMSSVTFGFTEPYLFGKPIQTGFTIYYQRYSYDQGRQESLIYGQNLLGYFNQVGSQGCPTGQSECNLLNYVQNGRGFTTFGSYQLKRSFARVGLSYSYGITSITPITAAAKLYFQTLDFENVGGPSAFNNLNGIRTSSITPTFAYNTVNHPIIPTKGLRVNASFGFTGSVLGGNVNMLQPSLDVAYFRRGIWKSNVMGFHLNTRVIVGYGGKVPPPFSRSYMGGENDVRGFDILTISPFGYIPTAGTVTQYHQAAPGQPASSASPYVYPGTATPVSVRVPSYQFIAPGGDTYSVFNYEYRIPIFGPVTLAPFFDAGVDRISFPGQLALNPDSIATLNAEFPSTHFNSRALIIRGSQKPRVSTGLELQVLMPVVNAPFRLYWAYNLSYLNTTLQPPVSISRDNVINDTTLQNALAILGQQIPFAEKHSLFRFSIGRTF